MSILISCGILLLGIVAIIGIIYTGILGNRDLKEIKLNLDNIKQIVVQNNEFQNILNKILENYEVEDFLKPKTFLLMKNTGNNLCEPQDEIPYIDYGIENLFHDLEDCIWTQP